MLRLLKTIIFSRWLRDYLAAPADDQLNLPSANRDSTAPSETGVSTHAEATNLLSQSYFDSAQKLRRSFPQRCSWLESGDLHFLEERAMGGGRYADAWRGRFDGRNVVIKAHRCYISFDHDWVRMRFYREAHAHSLLSHRNIVPFVGVYSTLKYPFSLVFDSPTEHINLTEYIRKGPRASKVQLVTGIARGLHHMHDLGVIHGNLESTNILVNSYGVPRITGMGSAFIPSFPIGWLDPSEFTRYSAPELVNPAAFGLPKAQTSKQSDVFAFGIIACEVFMGHHVFPHLVDIAVILSMSDGVRPPRPHDPELSDRVWDMINRCWANIPSQRITMGEAVSVLEAELQQAPGLFSLLFLC